jgi:hypothetical protein
MNIKSKKMLTLMILTIFAMSFVVLPTVYAIQAPTVSVPSVSVGDEFTVSGVAGDVTSGAEVEIYWDIVEGPNAHKIGSGYGAADGSYSVDVDAPADVAGSHYIWVKDTHTGATARQLGDILILPGISVSPDEGLPGDTVTVEGNGYDAEEDVWISFYNGVVYENITTATCDDSGYFTATFTVPTVAYGDYLVNATNYAGNEDEQPYKVGASISLSHSEGPSGLVVTIDGRGYTNGDLPLTNFEINGQDLAVDGTSVTVVNGLFSVDVIIPSLALGTYTIIVYDTVPGPGSDGSEEFEINGAPKVDIDPTFGAPGSSHTIRGYNFTQIAGTTVTIVMGDGTPHTTTTCDSNGEWEVTTAVPAKEFKLWYFNATDDNGVNGTDTFKIGILAVILTPTSGASGSMLTVTGVGFEAGADYNVTFNDEVVAMGVVGAGEDLSTSFYVPTCEAGEYSVLVNDEPGNELSVPYTCTGTTSLSASPSNVAVLYHLTLTGTNFKNAAATPVIYYIANETHSWEITADVMGGSTDEDGAIDATWEVDIDLILGNTYTINASTDGGAQYAETNITIVEEEVDIDTTQSAYALGDTITFKIKATFEKIGADLTIIDPSGNLYYMTELNTWTQVGDWQVVQVRNQVDDASGYPYILPEDAETGMWNWTITYTHPLLGDQMWTGLIDIVPATAAQLYDSLNAVADQLTNVTDIVNGQQGVIGDIQTGLSDLASTVAGNSDTLDSLSDQVASAVSQASSAVDAANQAVSAAQSATSAANQAASVAQEAVAAANSAKVEASSAKTAAQAAETAANAAADASNGLSTLVYGAIAASLIAALAAIVSLMQINKRIVG